MAPNSQRPRSSSSGSGWKVAVLVIVLLIAIAALAFLLYQLFGGDIAGLLGGSGSSANIAPGIFTQVNAEYGSGKNVAGNLTITEGTQRPESIPPEAEDVVLLDIEWTGKKEQTEPVYLTVSDPSFTDGDGLSVHEYNDTTGQWDLLGSYRIQNNSVTFPAATVSSFAFQVVSATPVATVSPEPVASTEPTTPTAEPTASPEPSPEPTPAPVAVVDYGPYATVQTGVFTMADQLEDGQTYAFALVRDLPEEDMAPAETDESADEANGGGNDASSDDGGVNFTYVDAPAGEETTGEAGEAGGEAGGEAAAQPETKTPMATVIMNMGGGTLGAVEMPLVQAADGTWCLAGPVTDGMIWSAKRDFYVTNDYRFSLANNGSYLNTDANLANIILTDNSVRTRWLVETATLADGSQISTLNYRDNDRFYVTDLSVAVEAVTDAMFPAGETPAEPNPLASQVTYVGTAAPADQTMLRQTLRFAVSKDQTLAQKVMVFKMDTERAVPDGVQTSIANRVTVPILDENSDLSNLDIRDGDLLLQLGVDYTVAAKVYNNSTVVVVISFMGKYTGQVVRTYEGTFFRTDPNQATPSPEPTPTAAPAYNGGGGGGGNGGGGNGQFVPPPSSGNNNDDPTNTYDDPTNMT